MTAHLSLLAEGDSIVDTVPFLRFCGRDQV